MEKVVGEDGTDAMVKQKIPEILANAYAYALKFVKHFNFVL